MRLADGIAIPDDLFCQGCGYNLRGLTSNRCPECGRGLDTIRAGVPQIPWVHRRNLGVIRAYWRTVWFVMFRQKQFCEELARPVDYADAQRFRWLTVMHMQVPLMLATIGWYIGAWPAHFTDPLQLFCQIWLAIGLHLCVFLFFAGVTGVPSYFFHPRGMSIEMQNRAIALSYYACCPLALAALPIAPATLLIWAASSGVRVNDTQGIGLVLLTAFLVGAFIYAWLIELIRINCRLMPLYQRRSYLIALFVPLLCILIGVATLIGIPLAIAFIVLVVASLG